MRGGERLVNECGWMSGICLRFHRLTGIFETIRYRCPSSVFFTNRFRSADCQKIQLSNFGMIATGNHNFERFAALCNTLGGSQGVEDLRFYHSTNGSVPSRSGGFYPPLRLACINRFLSGIVTGRVREPMYWYRPCALLSGGTAARADSIRPY